MSLSLLQCFRAKLSKMSVQVDELLLWKLVAFVEESGATDSMAPAVLLAPPSLELTRPDPLASRRCYFGTLDLELGVVVLSISTVPLSSLPIELQTLKQQFNLMLVSFQDATLTLPPFRQFHYFETFSFLLDSLAKFYSAVFRTMGQKLKIVGSMDAFGNLLGLYEDVLDSVPGLLLEGDLAGVIAGVSYGVTNAISKVASSMSHGVGQLSHDEWYETFKRQHVRCQPSADEGASQSLGQLYSGIKGLGTGLVFAVGAIPQHAISGGRDRGIMGVLGGLTTGALATVTRPVRGVLDFVDGTASAVKEFVGPPPGRQARMAVRRIRLPRVCTNLHRLLPPYSESLARAQQDLLRITAFSTTETCLLPLLLVKCAGFSLLDVETCYDKRNHGVHTVQQALISSNECYIIRQTGGDQCEVIQRIPYKLLKKLNPVASGGGEGASGPHTLIDVVIEEDDGRLTRAPRIACAREEIARALCEKILRAKLLYNHTKRSLKEDYERI